MREIVVGVTGASGSALAQRFLTCLCDLEEVGRIHLVVSESAFHVLEKELDIRRTEQFVPHLLDAGVREELIRLYENSDLLAPLSSGSYPHDGMVIIPTSMGTISSIAQGSSRNLIERAADVTLKEKRRLVVVPREAPLSIVHLKNLLSLAQAGATVIPAMLSFYQRPRTIQEMMDHLVARILDHLELEHAISKRWGRDLK